MQIKVGKFPALKRLLVNLASLLRGRCCPDFYLCVLVLSITVTVECVLFSVWILSLSLITVRVAHVVVILFYAASFPLFEEPTFLKNFFFIL